MAIVSVGAVALRKSIGMSRKLRLQPEILSGSIRSL